MPIDVLVPDHHGMAALSQVEGVRPIRFHPGEELPPDAASAEVLIPGFLGVPETVGMLDRLPKLRLIQLLSAGVEAWIGHVPDGVLLSNCRGAHSGSTAEWVVAVLLQIYRDLPAFADTQQAGKWDYHGTDTLQGKKILVVGAGDLGQALHRRLVPFDTTVALVGTTARDGVHGVDELPGLLPGQDVVVMMVPVTSRTVGMVDAEFLATMDDGAVLVNAARGSVVDTDALVVELAAGRLRAAIDVTDPEPLPPGHPLWTVPGLVLTPHVAATCRGGPERAYAVAAEQISLFARGEKPRNLVVGEY